MAHLTREEKIWLECELNKQILSKIEMAKRLGVDRKTVYNFIHKLKEFNSSSESYSRKVSIGHPKLNAQDISNLKDYVYDNPFANNNKIIRELKLNIQPQTLGNYLRKIGIGTCVAAKKPLINLRHMKARIDWADQHRQFTIDQWKKVIFTDESTFQNFSSGRQFVKRPKNERFNQKYVINYESQSNIKRNFFGIMIHNQPVKVFECTDNMDAAEFLNLMRERVLPAIEQVGIRDYIIQLDNAPIHDFALNTLKNEGYNFLPLAPKMCDISIIENIWGISKRIKNSCLLDKTVSNQIEFDELIKSIISEIPISTVNSLYESLPTRVQLLKQNNGKSIKY